MTWRTGAAVALLVGATACAGGPAPQQPPEAAAQQVVALLLLDDAAGACIEAAFTAEPDLAGIVNTGTDQLPEDRAGAALAAIRACADGPALFASLATIAAVTADADAEEQRCLRDAVGALPTGELDLLMLWAINPSAIDATGYLRFAQVSRSLAASCGLDLEMPSA